MYLIIPRHHFCLSLYLRILTCQQMILNIHLIANRENKYWVSDFTIQLIEDSLLKRGNFLPLFVHRIRCLGIEVYKCYRGLNPDNLNNLFKQSSTKYNMRDSCRLEQPKFNTFSYGQRSFRYYGSKLWNLYPYSVKNTKDLNVFKSNITRWCHSKQRDLLDVFWNHTRLPLCLYFIRHFIPLSIILDKYMSIYSSVFCLSPYTMYIYCHLCTCLSSLFPF